MTAEWQWKKHTQKKWREKKRGKENKGREERKTNWQEGRGKRRKAWAEGRQKDMVTSREWLRQKGGAQTRVCVCEGERGECAQLCAACGWASVQSSQIQVAPAAVSQNPITATTPFLRHTQPLSSLSSFLTARPNQTQWMSHSIPGYTLFSLWSHTVRFKRITAYQILYCVSLTPSGKNFLIEEKRICALHSIIVPIYLIRNTG